MPPRLAAPLAPAARRSAAASAAARLPVAAGARFSLKESSSQTDADYDRHKRDSLAKQRRGAGHWKPELASDSEEAVRADRGGAQQRGADDVARLQERTKRAAEETARAGTSVRDGM